MQQGKLDDARVTFEKLENIPGFAARAQYKQARVAFAARDNKRAVELAGKAALALKSYDAKLLYGNALFGLGEYQRAKDVYLSLRKMTPYPKVKAELAKKIGDCNKGLKRPENDGI